MKINLSLFAIIFVNFSVLASEVYTVDKAHAHIGFSIKHMAISKVKGQFKEYDAEVTLDQDNKLESARATIQVSSIDTGNKKRDAHLKKEDFFNEPKFPTIVFTSLRKEGEGKLIGNLTLHGITKEVTLEYKLNGPVQDPWGNTKIGIEANTQIDRVDFGMIGHSKMIGKKVNINIEIECAKK